MYRYSYTLSLTTALDRGGWPKPRPSLFIPGKRDPVAIVQGRSELVWRILLPPGFDPRTVRPVTSLYTGYVKIIFKYILTFVKAWIAQLV